MANNRLWLVCRCGDRLLLAKHFLNGWGERLFEPLDRWLEKHEVHFITEEDLAKIGDASSPYWDDRAPGWDHQFHLEYENGDPWHEEPRRIGKLISERLEYKDA